MNLRDDIRSAWNFTDRKSGRQLVWFLVVHSVIAALVAVVLGALASPLGPEVTGATAFLGADILYPAALVVLTIRSRNLSATWYLLLVPTLLLTRILGFLTALLVPTAMCTIRPRSGRPDEEVGAGRSADWILPAGDPVAASPSGDARTDAVGPAATHGPVGPGR